MMRSMDSLIVRKAAAKRRVERHGKVRVKGVITCPNAVLHEWLQQELTQILALLPPPPELSPEDTHAKSATMAGGLTDRAQDR